MDYKKGQLFSDTMFNNKIKVKIIDVFISSYKIIIEESNHSVVKERETFRFSKELFGTRDKRFKPINNKIKKLGSDD